MLAVALSSSLQADGSTISQVDPNFNFLFFICKTNRHSRKFSYGSILVEQYDTAVLSVLLHF